MGFRAMFFVLAALLGWGSWVLLGRLGKALWAALDRAPSRRVRLWVRLVLSAGLGGLCLIFETGMLITLCYMTLLCLLAAAGCGIYRRIRGRHMDPKVRFVIFAVVPFVITLGIMIYGNFNMNRVVQTNYSIITEKPLRQEGYRVAFLSDIHYDTIQSTDVLKNAIPEINALQPDIVVLGGDLMDESTSKESMQELFQVLSGLQAPLGRFYIYGNHDRQNYAGDAAAYTNEELEAAILAAGFTILDDDTVLINDELLLIGRADPRRFSESPRKALSVLLQNTPTGVFTLTLDHQPLETAENAAAGVDLTISGHTHGGQIFPLGTTLHLFGARNYGLYQTGDCQHIVSSGFAGWGFPFRTQRHCEYVIVDIQGHS